MKRPALGHLLGYTALTVMLTAGAAQSLAGSNTVFTDDIAPKQVYGGDIADNAVSGSKVYPNSLTGADVNERSLNMSGNCSDGMIKGNVLILGDQGRENIPDEYGSEAWGAYKYNCTGGRVFISRSSPGEYYVVFERNPHKMAVATPVTGLGDSYLQPVSVKVTESAPGRFYVNVFETTGGNNLDYNVALILW